MSSATANAVDLRGFPQSVVELPAGDDVATKVISVMTAATEKRHVKIVKRVAEREDAVRFVPGWGDPARLPRAFRPGPP